MLICFQIFPMVAYRTTEKDQLIKAVESYTSEVIILAPSVWDPSIRLEPPQKPPSMHKRSGLEKSLMKPKKRRVNDYKFFSEQHYIVTTRGCFMIKSPKTQASQTKLPV